MNKLQKLRLFKLAEHLETLPNEAVKNLDSVMFYPAKAAVDILVIQGMEPKLFHMRALCFTSKQGLGCCTLGWGIHLVTKDKRFTTLADCSNISLKLYGIDFGSFPWLWLFSGTWEDDTECGNKPHDAAKRIYWLLADRPIPHTLLTRRKQMQKLPSLKYLKARAKDKVVGYDNVSR